MSLTNAESLRKLEDYNKIENRILRVLSGISDEDLTKAEKQIKRICENE